MKPSFTFTNSNSNSSSNQSLNTSLPSSIQQPSSLPGINLTFQGALGNQQLIGPGQPHHRLSPRPLQGGSQLPAGIRLLAPGQLNGSASMTQQSLPSGVVACLPGYSGNMSSPSGSRMPGTSSYPPPSPSYLPASPSHMSTSPSGIKQQQMTGVVAIKSPSSLSRPPVPNMASSGKTYFWLLRAYYSVCHSILHCSVYLCKYNMRH